MNAPAIEKILSGEYQVNSLIGKQPVLDAVKRINTLLEPEVLFDKWYKWVRYLYIQELLHSTLVDLQVEDGLIVMRFFDEHCGEEETIVADFDANALFVLINDEQEPAPDRFTCVM